MRISGFHMMAGLLMGLLLVGSALADQPANQTPYGHGDDTKLPKGVIGLSLQIGAERIGDPAILYVGMVHPEGPAHKAGLGHGDEVVSVDGTAVKVGVKGEHGLRELSITRVAGDKLSRGPSGSHGNPAR
jgi:S1-C subfamily serine protease